MNHRQQTVKNEDGFILVTALMIMVVLTLIGTSAITTSNIESMIAVNDSLAKRAFYGADGGIQPGIELIEQNISCSTGFKVVTDRLGGIDLYNLDFAMHEKYSDIHGGTDATTSWDIPSDTIRQIRIPVDPANPLDKHPITNHVFPHTNIALLGSVTGHAAGSGGLELTGYDSGGQSAAKGGALIIYELHSQRIDIRNSEAIVSIDWRHIIGQEGNCIY